MRESLVPRLAAPAASRRGSRARSNSTRSAWAEARTAASRATSPRPTSSARVPHSVARRLGHRDPSRDLARHFATHGNVYRRTPIADPRLTRFVLAQARGGGDFVPFDEVVARYADLVPSTAPPSGGAARRDRRGPSRAAPPRLRSRGSGSTSAAASDGARSSSRNARARRSASIAASHASAARETSRAPASSTCRRPTGATEIPIDLSRLAREPSTSSSPTPRVSRLRRLVSVVVVHAGDAEGSFADAPRVPRRPSRVARRRAVLVERDGRRRRVPPARAARAPQVIRPRRSPPAPPRGRRGSSRSVLGVLPRGLAVARASEARGRLRRPSRDLPLDARLRRPGRALPRRASHLSPRRPRPRARAPRHARGVRVGRPRVGDASASLVGRRVRAPAVRAGEGDLVGHARAPLVGSPAAFGVGRSSSATGGGPRRRRGAPAAAPRPRRRPRPDPARRQPPDRLGRRRRPRVGSGTLGTRPRRRGIVSDRSAGPPPPPRSVRGSSSPGPSFGSSPAGRPGRESADVSVPPASGPFRSTARRRRQRGPTRPRSRRSRSTACSLVKCSRPTAASGPRSTDEEDPGFPVGVARWSPRTERFGRGGRRVALLSSRSTPRPPPRRARSARRRAVPSTGSRLRPTSPARLLVDRDAAAALRSRARASRRAASPRARRRAADPEPPSPPRRRARCSRDRRPSRSGPPRTAAGPRRQRPPSTDAIDAEDAPTGAHDAWDEFLKADGRPLGRGGAAALHPAARARVRGAARPRRLEASGVDFEQMGDAAAARASLDGRSSACRTTAKPVDARPARPGLPHRPARSLDYDAARACARRRSPGPRRLAPKFARGHPPLPIGRLRAGGGAARADRRPLPGRDDRVEGEGERFAPTERRGARNSRFAGPTTRRATSRGCASSRRKGRSWSNCSRTTPRTASRNFVFLAKAGFYDGPMFHRVIPFFMAQGGDPLRSATPRRAGQAVRAGHPHQRRAASAPPVPRRPRDGAGPSRHRRAASSS